MSAKPRKSQLSARHALNKREIAFCRGFAAAGFKSDFKVEAYIRAFYPDQPSPENDGTYVENEACPSRSTIGSRVNTLLKKEYIQRFLGELQSTPSERARDVLADTALFGTEAAQMRAAGKIIDEEDKLGMRDAYQQWAETMCAVGAEVVVPVPGGGEIIIPLGSLFPQYKEALPPVEVLRKTEESLREYREKREAQDAEDYTADDPS